MAHRGVGVPNSIANVPNNFTCYRWGRMAQLGCKLAIFTARLLRLCETSMFPPFHGRWLAGLKPPSTLTC